MSHEGSNEQNGTSNEEQVSKTNVTPRLLYDKGSASYVLVLKFRLPVRSLSHRGQSLMMLTCNGVVSKRKPYFISDIVYDNVKKYWESDGHKKLSQDNFVQKVKETDNSQECQGKEGTSNLTIKSTTNVQNQDKVWTELVGGIQHGRGDFQFMLE
ncbi:hypothetical protein M9H77_31978 [Catharanthus roseus]|uniref:Uncharacterized protein n=1 Tax=Catharanthus roseus TaxID=4058 RepID=A0ACC0A210_CATRO|nr:hypothetical protein M9H77_31978 [Catharanthus roseus]